MLNFILLNVKMQNDVMLIVITLIVIMLGVVAPSALSSRESVEKGVKAN
jgi:hypothetical protein